MNNNGELTVNIPIGDWQAETLRDESVVTTREDVIAQLSAGTPTGKIARAVIVSREMGHAPDDIIAPNKILLYTAGRLEVSRLARQETHDVEAHGVTYQAPNFIGPVLLPVNGDTEDAESDGQERLLECEVEAIEAMPDLPTTYTAYTDKRSADVAEAYLSRKVPGHVWPRLLTLKEHGRDVRRVVGELKRELDDMAARLA